METQQEQMINLVSFAFVLAVMLAGAIGHWIKKKARKQIRGNLISYLFADSPGNSAMAGGSIIVASIAAAATGAADFIDPRLLWGMAVTTGNVPAHSFFMLGTTFTTGWALDSGFNKGGTP